MAGGRCARPAPVAGSECRNSANKGTKPGEAKLHSARFQKETTIIVGRECQDKQSSRKNNAATTLPALAKSKRPKGILISFLLHFPGARIVAMAISLPPDSELDFQAIFEATPTPYLILTPTLHIVAVNAAYLQATQRSRSDLIGRYVFDAFPDNPHDPAADGVQNLRRSLERVVSSQARDTMPVQKYDIPIGDPAQQRFEERYWSPINTPVFDAHGRMTHIIHRVEDVTEYVQARSRARLNETRLEAQAQEIQAANQRLHKSQLQAMEAARQANLERQRLDAVLDAAPVGIFVLDAHGLLLKTNDSNRHLWGAGQPPANSNVDFATWVGWWADGSARHGQRVAPHEWPLARAIRGEEVMNESIDVNSFDLPPIRRSTLVSAAPVRNAEGEIIGAVAVVMDISDRLRAEVELREANRRKDEFLAMLAHELRNPLAPISAAADLLAMNRLDAEVIRKTSAILTRQVRHMTDLVDDLLDVSRVTRGLVKLQKKPLDIKRVLIDALEQARPLIEARGHRLHVDTTPSPAIVLGDQNRLVQVIANLVNNAAKYTPEGGRIGVAVVVEHDEVIVHVDDNGIGMSSTLIGTAFDLFAQAERTSDRAEGGLGIGLALVKSLVQLHGGGVSASSEGNGKGSRFTVRLPLLDQAGMPAMLLHDAAHAPQTRSLKVLIVDDNADAARTLTMLVEALGHQARIEHSPGRVLERLDEELPDVFLLDIGLPGMDGYTLARRLRAEPRTAKAVLIAVTGYGQEQDRENAFDAGFDNHLVKPTNTAQLAELLREIGQRDRKHSLPPRPD